MCNVSGSAHAALGTDVLCRNTERGEAQVSAPNITRPGPRMAAASAPGAQPRAPYPRLPHPHADIGAHPTWQVRHLSMSAPPSPKGNMGTRPSHSSAQRQGKPSTSINGNGDSHPLTSDILSFLSPSESRGSKPPELQMRREPLRSYTPLGEAGVTSRKAEELGALAGTSTATKALQAFVWEGHSHQEARLCTRGQLC